MNDPIDWQECLRVNNNKIDVAKELLGMLNDELPALQKNIASAYAKKDFNALYDNIHKLHGACCYCGATQLRTLLEKSEKILKLKQYDDIDLLIKNIKTEISRLLLALQRKRYNK